MRARKIESASLARLIDSKVAGFARQVGQAGEARLLVLAALVLADELTEANEARAPRDGSRPADNAAVAGSVSRLAQRIEAVAARLEIVPHMSLRLWGCAVR